MLKIGDKVKIRVHPFTGEEGIIEEIIRFPRKEYLVDVDGRTIRFIPNELELPENELNPRLDEIFDSFFGVPLRNQYIALYNEPSMGLTFVSDKNGNQVFTDEKKLFETIIAFNILDKYLVQVIKITPQGKITFHKVEHQVKTELTLK